MVLLRFLFLSHLLWLSMLLAFPPSNPPSQSPATQKVNPRISFNFFDLRQETDTNIKMSPGTVLESGAQRWEEGLLGLLRPNGGSFCPQQAPPAPGRCCRWKLGAAFQWGRLSSQFATCVTANLSPCHHRACQHAIFHTNIKRDTFPIF